MHLLDASSSRCLLENGGGKKECEGRCTWPLHRGAPCHSLACHPLPRREGDVPRRSSSCDWNSWSEPIKRGQKGMVLSQPGWKSEDSSESSLHGFFWIYILIAVSLISSGPWPPEEDLSQHGHSHGSHVTDAHAQWPKKFAQRSKHKEQQGWASQPGSTAEVCKHQDLCSASPLCCLIFLQSSTMRAACDHVHLWISKGKGKGIQCPSRCRTLVSGEGRV